MSKNSNFEFGFDDDDNEFPEKLEELNLEDDIIIDEINEIDDSDINTEENFEDLKIESVDSESEFDIYYKYNTNNHRQEFKHSLSRDTILHGKKNPEEENPEEHYINEIDSIGDGGVEKGSDFEFESKNFMDYVTKKKLQEDVYGLLKDRTNLDFQSNRRKPNKQTFNDYYTMLLKELSGKYPNYEIFVELSYYFTDNIFNMYKLLDKSYATKIIIELKDKGYLRGLDKINFK